jgi:hypothetical protein
MKHLKGHCQVCGGHIEFPADAIGTNVDCPHCGQVTELLLAAPAEEPTIPRRTIVWTGITILMLLIAFAGALVALKRAEKKAVAKQEANKLNVPPPAAATPPVEPAAVSINGFSASEVILQKNPGSSLVYAVGTLTNKSEKQRFGVKVLLDLMDATGNKVGQATDYQQVMEPNGQWYFKALVVEKKVATAKIAGVQESQ